MFLLQPGSSGVQERKGLREKGVQETQPLPRLPALAEVLLNSLAPVCGISGVPADRIAGLKSQLAFLCMIVRAAWGSKPLAVSSL
jgi:hypothetical protein